MKIPVNLASEPFRRDRPLIAASAAVALMLTCSFVFFVYLSIAERERAREAREAMEAMTRQLNTLSAEQAKVEAVLRETRNAEVLDRSQFVNLLIARKAVSWTKIFSDLEEVLPFNVRLVSIRPQISPQNELLLDMVVASQADDNVRQFLMRLESSPVFGTTTVHNWLPPSQSDPLYRFRVSVQYAQKL